MACCRQSGTGLLDIHRPTVQTAGLVERSVHLDLDGCVDSAGSDGVEARDRDEPRAGVTASTSPVPRERRQVPDSPSAARVPVPSARSSDHARQQCRTNDRRPASGRGGEPVERGVVNVQRGLVVGQDHGVVAHFVV
jgi:hypothetical protein